MKNFKIHLYSICYNEQVMLPHFIDHYSSFCDKLFIYDNFSTDLSSDICKNNNFHAHSEENCVCKFCNTHAHPYHIKYCST
mgnify:CR=1 FL=1